MAVMNRPCFLPCLFFVSFVSLIPFSSSQSSAPQNFEAFYPFSIETPSPAPPPDSTLSSSPLAPQSLTPPPSPKSSSNKKIAKAVAVTACTTFVASLLFFFLIQRCVIAPRRTKVANESGGGHPAVYNDQSARIDGNVKRLIVDENGLDVVYWRQLQRESKKNSYHKEILHGSEEEYGSLEMAERKNEGKKSEPIQEIPLLLGKSSASHKFVEERVTAGHPRAHGASDLSSGSATATNAIEKRGLASQPSNPPRSPSPASSSVPIPNRQGNIPPPPIQAEKNHTPPPNPPTPPTKSIPNKQLQTPPLPPPLPAKKNLPPVPPPPKTANLSTSSKVSAVPKGIRDGEQQKSSSGEGVSGAGNGQVKLKPLHWDKLNKNGDHSMVWDKIDGGSFRFDDDLMEALFGYVATNRKSPKRDRSTDPNKISSSPPAQITILDARKSQNVAIVVKSLGISREQILDAISEGQGLDADTLEKLMRIAPTEEEQSQIIKYNGDPTRLANAESFLYHLLKAVPSAFRRLDAMLFRSNYHVEIANFQESLQTIEQGCKELRNRGLFIKLLEAILKAGNRMNAGTLRGNAQAFKLSSLHKLSDVKSTDGKTTLLHFVVEEVVRSEGKRCVLSRNRSLSRSSSRSSSVSGVISEHPESREERQREYIKLGLPVVGGLSAEFSNVKRAAQIDYSAFAGTCTALTARITELRSLVSEERSKNGIGRFVTEMESFVKAAEGEVEMLKGEKVRIMELVKKTTDYYQARAAKDEEAHPLQLFAIIKDFLGMVDHVCLEIARRMQRRKTASSGSGSSPRSPETKTPVRFPNLPAHFIRGKSRSSSSESDTDF